MCARRPSRAFPAPARARARRQTSAPPMAVSISRKTETTAAVRQRLPGGPVVRFRRLLVPERDAKLLRRRRLCRFHERQKQLRLCGNVCPATQSCVSGACSCPSATPNFCAAVGCVDFMKDRNNCGSCGNVCPATLSCVSGTCSCQATDEPTLRACLAEAVPGGAIQVIGTITLNSPATTMPALVVGKSVKFLGGQNSVLQSTTVESAAPKTFIEVTADNVEFGSGLTIKQRAPVSNDQATAIASGTVVNGLVSAAAVEFVEFGYSMRGSFNISGSTKYMPPGRPGNNHRHVAVYKMTADSAVHDLTFDFPPEATP